MKIRLGISTCPNDTFAFHAILNRRIGLRGLDFEIELLDVQQLNEGIARGAFDVAKASFNAALRLADRWGILRSGSALGFGVGPLLLGAREGNSPQPKSRILCPGAQTTAALLVRMFFPECANVSHCLFSEIMPALGRGEADFGAVIHEGRFVYEREGLYLACDLGERWERETGAPLPLGGILARLDLSADIHRELNALIRDSIDHAHAHREEAFTTMRHYASELEPDVIWDHVKLYVNEDTRELSPAAVGALDALRTMAVRSGAVASSFPAPVLL